MAHEAEQIGLATFILVDRLLEELEATHPGIKGRVVANAKASVAASPGPNASKMLAVLADFK